MNRPHRAAAPLRHGAGVIVHDGAGKVLLGLQKDGWASFGGKAENAETPVETARRECGEETLFVISCVDHPLVPMMTSVTPRGRAFHLFSMRIAHDPGVVQRFDAARDSGEYAARRECCETRQIGWFALEDVSRLTLRPSFRADVAVIIDALRGSYQ